MYRSLILFFLFIPASAFAQITITGRVLIQGSKTPVADATIFLSQTRSGTKTDKDGVFALYSVKAGKYDVVISCIGYEPYFGEVSIKYSDVKLPDIKLVPRVNQLAEVKIRPTKKIKRDWKRENQIRTFTDEFLGHTSNASECKILNTQLLIFEENEAEQKLTAKTNDFLIIENKALGYRIKYLVNSFLVDGLNGIISYTGSSVFEDLPGNPNQQAAWKVNRENTYRTSSMKFFRSCIADLLPQSDFYVFKLIRVPTSRLPDSIINLKLRQMANLRNDSVKFYNNELKMPKYEQTSIPKPLPTTEFIKLTGERGIFDLNYLDGEPLMISYRSKTGASNKYTSFITFVKPDVYFDSNGIVFTPKNAIIEGYWAKLRVGDLLPVDYEVGK
ncbi:carboxypeptidase-like regulatory domain-containing protein [Mucilaginibacter lutimaris]|uniref:Carboxypeptidase-like regulatory domain-containing protein n=1 Tax=Mucilaginibacter lutimaris TaxID=931629 RepID=A0ABW2ZLD8_9SPHI